MSAELQVLGVELLGEERRWEWEFERGLNVIVGPVGVGKTTLLNLIRFGLGGGWEPTKKARESAHAVRLRIRAGEADLVITRRFGANVATLDEDGTGERDVAIGQRRKGHRLLSDVLLDRLGIPALRVPSSKPKSGKVKAGVKMTGISFIDILSYLYLEQEDIDRQTARSEDKVLNVKRQYIFELLYGLLDSQIATLQEAARDLATQAQKLKDERTVTERLAERYQQAISKLISPDETRRHLSHVEEELRGLAGQRGRVEEETVPLRDRVAATLQHMARVDQQLAHRQRELDRFEGTLAQLDVDIERANRAADATERFEAFEYRICPRCLQDLEQHRHDDEHCTVCGQPEQTAPAQAEILAASARRSAQRAEAGELRDQVAAEVSELEAQRSQLSGAIRDAQEELAAASVRIRELDDRRTLALAEQAVAHRELALVSELPRPGEAVESVDEKLAALAKSQDELAAAIEDRRVAIAENHGRIADLSEIFRDILALFELPWFEGQAWIDETDYLPRVDGLGLKALSSGGMKATVNLAYYLANLTLAIRDREVLMPRFMMIDGLRKDYGAGADDLARAEQIYRFLLTQQDSITGPVARSFQMIVVDNDLPMNVSGRVSLLELNYDTPLISDEGEDTGTTAAVPTPA